MKQLLVLSGKGGTGKTTVATALIKLSKAKIYADCDVDAPNLHLLMEGGEEPKKSNYYGLPKGKINDELCVRCHKCVDKCRFEAIKFDKKYVIDPYACEGCGVCQIVCKNGAITLEDDVAGNLMLYTENRVFSTAKLKMGSGTTGKLVTEVKNQMKKSSNDEALAIIDGSPGIGCPVIASLNGANMVLVVAEPSISGISDMERIIETARSFQVKIAVCVNKFNTNIDKTKEIERFCVNNNLPFIGKIPFDYKAVEAINNGFSVVDVECASGDSIKEIFEKTIKILYE